MYFGKLVLFLVLVPCAVLVSARVDTRPILANFDIPFFSKPYGIAVDAEQSRIFVTNLGDDTITVIDGKNYKPITKIPVDLSPYIAMFQPVTKKLYSYNPAGDTVAVIDTAKTGYPVKSIRTGKQPYGIDFNTETNRVYVSNAGDASISIIDGNSDEVVTTVALPQGARPSILSVNRKLNKIYVAASGSNFVSVIDGKTNTVEKQIIVGQNPTWVRYLPELNRVFVAVEGERKIVIINPENNEIIQTIDTGAFNKPSRILFDPRTEYVYISLRDNDKMLVLARDKSASPFRIIEESAIPFFGQLDARPYSTLAIDEKTGFVYFTSGSDNTVAVVRGDLNANGIINPVWYATINADGSVLYAQGAKEKMERKEGRWTAFVSLLGSIKLPVSIAIVVIAAVGIAMFIKRRA